MSDTQSPQTEIIRHKRWVKGAHFMITLSFLALTVSGYVILMSHPRLYWGKAGNDLTPALFELPISRNYHHGGWEKQITFKHLNGSQVSAVRTYDIFNENGWARSMHFLAAWFLVITGIVYFVTGLFSGHFRNNLSPRRGEFSFKLFWKDFVSHFRKQTHYSGKYGRAIGLSLGGTTGYAINPARDLGPRIMHAILPIKSKGTSDWAYAWIPVLGPIIGAAIAALIFMQLR